jgi:hypothetical protein
LREPSFPGGNSTMNPKRIFALSMLLTLLSACSVSVIATEPCGCDCAATGGNGGAGLGGGPSQETLCTLKEGCDGGSGGAGGAGGAGGTGGTWTLDPNK